MEEVAYYQGEQVIEQYANRADDGLTPEEQTVVSKHFTDPDARILDLGCGTGRTTAPLDAMGYDIVGVDLSEALVEEARKSHPEVSFQVGDATDLSFPDESFDYALFTDRGIDDIPTKAERMRAILEVWRVLRPGGVFAFDVNNQLSRFVFDPRSLEAWGRQLRFLARNLWARSLTSRYASIEFQYDVDIVYAITPWAQRRQLRDVGFEEIEVVKRRSISRPVLLDTRPFFVARKPTEFQ